MKQNVLSAAPQMRSALKRQSGQALVETSLVMGAMIATLIVTLPVVALAAARLWVGHSLYERVRCELSQSSSNERRQCDLSLKKRVAPLWWGRLETPNVYVTDTGSSREAVVKAEWCNTNSRSICPNDQKLDINLKIREKEIKDLL